MDLYVQILLTRCFDVNAQIFGQNSPRTRLAGLHLFPAFSLVKTWSCAKYVSKKVTKHDILKDCEGNDKVTESSELLY